MSHVLYAIDFGGSGARIAEMNPDTGELGEIRVIPMDEIVTNDDLSERIASMIPAGSDVGVGAAGLVTDLHIIGSPNSRVKDLSFPEDLAQRGDNVTAGNDLSVAVEGFAKFDPQAKEYRVVAVQTFSSGYNGQAAYMTKVFTALELGHLPGKNDRWCGCGHMRHIEPSVSGTGAAMMAKEYFMMTRDTEHPILELTLRAYNDSHKENYSMEDLRKEDSLFREVVGSITAKEVYMAYKANPEMNPQREIRNLQVEAFPFAFGNMATAGRHPEGGDVQCIGLMGGLTKDWDILFKPAIDAYKANSGDYQHPNLSVPEFVRCDSNIGLIGAGAYWINHNQG